MISSIYTIFYKYVNANGIFSFYLVVLYFRGPFNKAIIPLALVGYEIEKKVVRQGEEMR